MSKSYSKTRVLVECALMVAIGTVLANIKIFTMPNGGSVTLQVCCPSCSSPSATASSGVCSPVW